MLVLSRQRNEGIVITVGEHTIEVFVLEIRGDKVRLGLQAPIEFVTIHRAEVQRAIEREKVRAAEQGTGTSEAPPMAT